MTRLALLLLVSRTAIAAPPSGYQCGDGKPIIDRGCACPVNFAAARDGEDIAICIVKAVPAPQEPAPKSAQQAFEQAERWFAQLGKLPVLKGTLKDLGEQTRIMVKATGALAARYDAVIRFKDPSWTLAAQVRKGDIYEWMADRALATPVPRGMTEESFRPIMNVHAFSLQNQAVDAWRAALALATSSSIWNDQLEHANNRLVRYRPKEYRSRHTPRMPASTPGDPADAGRWNDAAVKFLAARSFDDAKDAADKSLGKAPTYAKAQVNLASALRGLDRFDEAEARYAKALEADPKLADAAYNLVILELDRATTTSMGLVGRSQRARAAITKLQPLDAKAALALEPEVARLERDAKTALQSDFKNKP